MMWAYLIFRMKMDAVPGTPTTLWFTPIYTTEEMKEKTGNPDFVYEISCDQMCGKGHFSMRGVIIVETNKNMTNGWSSKNLNIYKAIMPRNGCLKQHDSTKTVALANSHTHQ